MPKKSRPHTGSKGFYPRKRAARQTPSFNSFPVIKGEQAKPLNFFGYKAGMLHVMGRDVYNKSPSYGQEIVVPATVIECPPVRVFGVRAYGNSPHGLKTLTEVSVEKPEKHLLRKIVAFKQHKSKKKKAEGKPKTFEDLEKMKEQIAEIRLLVHTQPFLAGFGKKRPDVSEISLTGTVEKQLVFAKEKLGKDLHASDVFVEKQVIDVKAVSRGRGMEGVIQRHNVKKQRRKAKTERIVGSIGPWHPPTVMWTVARAGQLGYQTRTEYGKKILAMGEKVKEMNPKSGFANFGLLKNESVLLAGSVPGVVKRCIALRTAIRPVHEHRVELAEIDFVSTKEETDAAGEEEIKIGKVKAEKEVKQEKKSVADEIAEAAKA
jgi:large subunit ribosomal protein L3